MIKADEFIGPAKALGFSLYTGVPCSYLKPFINYVIDAPDLKYVPAVNEGDGVAIAAGSQIAGQRAVVMFQNSGLGNAVSPLTSLTYTFRLPVLIIVTLRGEPGGPADEPQHELMGQITTDMLELMKIDWAYFPMESSNVEPVLARAVKHMDETGRPFALVMQKGAVEKWPVPKQFENKTLNKIKPIETGDRKAIMSRKQALEIIQSYTENSQLVFASTGFTGRELYALDDRENQLYMVGSMGCASSMALGAALAQPDRQIVVVDGDGAALMRMGAMATIGFERPPNLLHILLDNSLHESTGGQSTVSGSVDFCAVAAANGYQQVAACDEPEQLEQQIAASGSSLSFIHVKTLPGVPENLPRPSIKPVDVAKRLASFAAQKG